MKPSRTRTPARGVFVFRDAGCAPGWKFVRPEVVVRTCLPGCAAVLFLLGPGTAPAQSFADWQREQKQAVAQETRDFQHWRHEQSQQFLQELKTEWQAFTLYKAQIRDPHPKPKRLPRAPDQAAPQPVPATSRLPVNPDAGAPTKPISPIAPQTPPQAAPPAAPRAVPQAASQTRPKGERVEPSAAPAGTWPGDVSPVGQRPERETRSQAPLPGAGEQASVQFYGNPVPLSRDPAWQRLTVKTLVPVAISGFWEGMTASAFDKTLISVNQSAQSLGLDDWGQVLLWHEVARALRPGAPREQLLTAWFFLVKSGIDARLGYAGDQLYLLLAIEQPVYAVRYLKLDGRTYYPLFQSRPEQKAGTFSTFSGKYPQPLRPVAFRAAASDFVRLAGAEKRFSFEYGGRPIHLDVAYAPGLVHYLDRYPQLDFDLYFQSRPAPATRLSLANALRPHLQGLGEADAVNLLLAFVQKAFVYRTDAEQFGQEKYFFPEDVLHYPYSDCEDRAALFAWLVRELLGLKTVGLHYPGHMATGVAVKAPQPGWQQLEWAGQRYVLADPTYVNATLGMAMPAYAETAPLHVISPD